MGFFLHDDPALSVAKNRTEATYTGGAAVNCQRLGFCHLKQQQRPRLYTRYTRTGGMVLLQY